jgi:hypothetical protein
LVFNIVKKRVRSYLEVVEDKQWITGERGKNENNNKKYNKRKIQTNQKRKRTTQE